MFYTVQVDAADGVTRNKLQTNDLPEVRHLLVRLDHEGADVTLEVMAEDSAEAYHLLNLLTGDST